VLKISPRLSTRVGNGKGVALSRNARLRRTDGCERWHQIKAAFSKALELLPEERAAYLQSLSDAAVRVEVESLLASNRQAETHGGSRIRLDADPADHPEEDPWIGKNIAPTM